MSQWRHAIILPRGGDWTAGFSFATPRVTVVCIVDRGYPIFGVFVPEVAAKCVSSSDVVSNPVRDYLVSAFSMSNIVMNP